MGVTKLINFHISKWWTYFLKNRYIIGHDAGRWLKVDSRTGEIQFSREFDKKSKYITNGIYTAEILAIDGKKFIFNAFIKLSVCIKYEYYSNVGRRLTQIKYIIQGCLQDLQSSKCHRKGGADCRATAVTAAEPPGGLREHRLLDMLPK